MRHKQLPTSTQIDNPVRTETTVIPAWWSSCAAVLSYTMPWVVTNHALLPGRNNDSAAIITAMDRRTWQRMDDIADGNIAASTVSGRPFSAGRRGLSALPRLGGRLPKRPRPAGEHPATGEVRAWAAGPAKH